MKNCNDDDDDEHKEVFTMDVWNVHQKIYDEGG